VGDTPTNQPWKLLMMELHQGWVAMMEKSIPIDRVLMVKDIELFTVKMKKSNL